MKIEAVIFDMDGTLIDSIGVWKKMNKLYLDKKGVEYEGEIYPELKSGNAIQQGAAYFKRRFGLKETIKEIIDEWTAMMLPFYREFKPKPYVRDFLEYLSQNSIKTAIATSNSKTMADEFLSSKKLTDFFDVVVGGMSVKRGKPFADIFVKAAKLVCVKPSNCVVIEDSLSGIDAARNAGMRVFLIKDDYQDFDKLKHLVDYAALDYLQIMEKFKQLL